MPLFLAWRYARTTGREHALGTMTTLAVVSITVGTFALALTNAVMTGFESVIHERMQGIHAQLTIQTPHDALNVQAIADVIDKEFPQIAHYAPHEVRQVIASHKDHRDIRQVIAIKGVNPERERLVSSLESKLIVPHKETLPNLLNDNGIIMGKSCAQAHEFVVGDEIDLLFLPGPSGKKLNLSRKRAVIKGIFQTGIEEIDSSLIISSLAFLQTMFPDALATTISLKLAPDAHESEIKTKLAQRLNGLDVYSWKDVYPALVSALKLEKYVMFLILALITLVASMNIVSLLFMKITHKRHDLALLLAMGANPNMVTRIFTYLGLLISGSSALIGIGLAWITSFILNRYPFITLPDVYYVTTLPVHMNLSITLSTFMVVIIISLIAVYIPTRGLAAKTKRWLSSLS